LAEYSAVNRKVVGSSPTPGATSQRPGAGRNRAPMTIEDLQRWEEHGAIWRARELSDERAVLELCTCYGEPVDLVQTRDPKVIDFVRRHRAGG
jgi:hypothetical protein